MKKSFLIVLVLLLSYSCSNNESSNEDLDDSQFYKTANIGDITFTKKDELKKKKPPIYPLQPPCNITIENLGNNNFLPNGAVAQISYEPVLNGCEGYAIFDIRVVDDMPCQPEGYLYPFPYSGSFLIPTLYENSAYVIFSLSMFQSKVFEYRFRIYGTCEGISCYSETDWHCFSSYDF